MNPANDHDEPLRKKMRSWQLSTGLPPRFQEEVWRRIARAQTERAQPWWKRIADWFEAALPQPAVATSYLASLVLLGLVGGWWDARELKTRFGGQMGSRYGQAGDA